ncbi:MAG: recombinase family protein [Reyranellaceae bacterium]
MLTFAYARVSTSDQTTANQLLELRTAGFEPDATYSEVISGRVAAADRPQFAKLLDAVSRMNGPRRVVVTRLDRLGRDALDVQGTVRRLAEMGCAVHVLQLGGLDLASSAGKLVLSTLAAVAEMERDLLIERTHAGLARARAEGRKGGRRPVTNDGSRATIKDMLGTGASVAATAKAHGVSRQTVMRVRDAPG